MVRSTLVASLFAAIACFLSPPSVVTADPYVTVTNCEMVAVGGQSADRLTLRILAKTGYITLIRAYVGPHAGYGDTCHVLEATPAPGWAATLEPDGGADWYATAIDGGIRTGTSLDGFRVTLSRPTCCVEFVFFNPLGDVTGSSVVCFESCLTTPAVRPSWGRLKAIYR